MIKNRDLKLQEDDPRVVEARNAEQRLFDFYGLETKIHYLQLPRFGFRIRIIEIGSGNPVLIVPGNNGDSFPFAPLLPELKGRRIIIVNRPGGGLSEGMDHRKMDFHKFAVETLTFVLDSLKLERVPIIAHSIAGYWGLWFAMDRPERVSALILLGVNVSNNPPFSFRLLSVPILNRYFYSKFKSDNPEKSLGSLVFMGHSQETCGRLPKAMSECYYYFNKLPHSKISMLSLMESVNCLRGTRRRARISMDQLKTVKQSTMFIWGTNDPSGSTKDVGDISRTMTSSEFHTIQGGGHLAWLDNPIECGRLIQKFISNY
jgi:2-hydroxy-6-oxonona-2,4-dienedioate hydrolase